MTWERDTKGLQAASAQKADIKEYYQKALESIDAVTKYDQTIAGTLRDNLQAYIEESRQARQPLTVAGMIKASVITRDAYYRLRDGESDWMLPAYMDRHDIPVEMYGAQYVDENGQVILLVRLSDVIKNAELDIQADREALCMDRNARQVSGAIFLLKAQQGLQDTPTEKPTYSSNTLIIADREQAQKALELLNPSNCNDSSL